MTQFTKQLICVLILLAGCASAPKGSAPFTSSVLSSATDNPVEQAAYAQSDVAINQPESVLADKDAEPLPTPLVEEPSSEGLTVDALERLALMNNPSVGQASARVRALRGKYVQVGLPPNPSVGYVASEVGNDGRGGQQGAFAGQDFIRGGKLEKNRAIVAAEIDKAEQNLVATQRRVQTDVRTAYFRVLVAQKRVELATTLVEANSEAVKASQELLDAEEVPRVGVLQTEVELQNAKIVLQTAENQVSAAWQQLSAVVGDLDLQPQKLAGDPTAVPAELDWEETLARVTTLSPEMAAAMAELSRSRRALTRAYVEPVPDISSQLSVQYDDSTDNTIGGIQVGIPLPLWNKNQGGIRQAQAEITVASQNIDRVALDLKTRLAGTFRDYTTARAQAETYATEILPRAQRTFDLVRQGYSQGEAGYLDLLAAQRTYTQTNLAYLESLDLLWQSWTRIDGLLLSDSLSAPTE